MLAPDENHKTNTLSVLLFSGGDSYVLGRCLASLSQMSGVTFEVIVIPYNDQPPELIPGEFAGRLRFAKHPIDQNLPKGSAILALRDTWFPGNRGWLSEIMTGLGKHDAIAIPVLPAWRRVYQIQEPGVETERCILWRREVWRRNHQNQRSDALLSAPEDSDRLHCLCECPLYERGPEPLNIEPAWKPRGWRASKGARGYS